MEDIASLQDFADNDAPVYASIETTGISIQVFVSALIVVGLATEWSASGIEFWRGLALATVYGVMLGLLSGTLGYLAERGRQGRKALRSLQSLFESDPTRVPPAPADATARLLAAILIGPRQFCGGILYVLPAKLFFQPHYPTRRFRRGPRVVPEGLIIQPARTITLGQAALRPAPWWRQPFFRAPLPLIICSWEHGVVALRVPKTPVILERLQQHVDRLRASEAVQPPHDA